MVIVLAAFFFSYYFVNVAGIPNWIKAKAKMKVGARIKPFDCVTCLSVWIAIVLYFTPEYISYFTAVIFGAGFIGNKLK